MYILISIERIDNFYRTEMDGRVGGKEFVRTLPWNRLGYLFVRSSMQLRFSIYDDHFATGYASYGLKPNLWFEETLGSTTVCRSLDPGKREN